MTKAQLSIGLAIVLAALAGCGGKRDARVTYHDPNMDFSLVQTVAVMPFDDLSGDQAAAQRVRDLFMTMLQATGAMYVLPTGEVARGIERTSLDNPSAPSAEDVTALAKALGADVVVTGSVLEYGEARSGSASANYVSVSLQMLEGQTGRVVWSASATRGGVSAGNRMFGGGGQPMNAVTVKALDDVLDQLFAQ